MKAYGWRIVFFASHRLTISTYIKDAGDLLLQKASRP
jgi:hypothetical protein